MGYLGRSPTPSPIDSSDIPANSIDASKIIDGAIAVADVADNAITEAKIADAAVVSLKSGRKNLIINGDMKVSQRGDYTTASAATNDSYSLDRWRDWSGIARTFQHTTGLTINGTTNKKGLKYVATAASSASYMGTRQKLEGEDVPNGVVVTSSCMMRTNNANARIRTYGIVSGGVTSAACPSDGNWHKVTLTQTTNTVGTPEVGVLVYNGNETTTSIAVGDYIEVADFQLEVGSVATDFEHRSYGEELALCQRYYEKSYDKDSYAGSAFGYNTPMINTTGPLYDWSRISSTFAVEKRATPSVIVYGHAGPSGVVSRDAGGTFYETSGSVTASTRIIVVGQSGGTAGYGIAAQWTADAEL